MDFKKNQKHPDWLTVLVSCVISEWLCHLQWTWTSYWWVLDGNLFERHSLEILDAHTHILTHIHKHTLPCISERERESPNSWLSMMDRLMQRLFEVTEWTRFSAADPFWLFLHFTLFGWAQMFTGKSQYFYCWYFYTMSVWVVWLGKLTGLMVGIIRKAMFCFDKHSAKQLKEKKVRRNSLPVYTCQHMKVI